ncbi:MAG: putative endonuclease 4 [Bacteroidetes bacterium]|nr:putative endonuclease 4 [Bacteroidota bacterium]
MNGKLLLGAHMSINGGVHTAFARGLSVGCTTMQVFNKNNNRWNAPRLSNEDIQNYKREEVKARISPVVSHAAYLINLCATNENTLQQSRKAFLDELNRCEALEIVALIFHPGAHLGAGEDEGIKRIAESLNVIHEQAKGNPVLSTLESTAGQGSAIGYRFEHLRSIIDLVDDEQRMAVCIDTCHLLAAGYDITTERGWSDTVTQFDDIVGLKKLVAVHVNDSKKELGSRVDRHEHIGKGQIGLDGFRGLMNDPRFENIPKILETPKSEDMHEDIENLSVLRSLIKTKSAQDS